MEGEFNKRVDRQPTKTKKGHKKAKRAEDYEPQIWIF